MGEKTVAEITEEVRARVGVAAGKVAEMKRDRKEVMDENCSNPSCPNLADAEAMRLLRKKNRERMKRARAK